MNFKLFGSILLVVGTCIGAGMLGLPIVTSQLGWSGSVIQLLVCWLVMTTGAFLLLEANLWMPLNSNLVTMAGKTTGLAGQCLAWLSMLFLMYSLLCAYIAGGSDLFYQMTVTGLSLPRWLMTIVFVAIFASVIWLGTASIDYVNRGLMLVKFSAYFLLAFLLLPFVSQAKLGAGSLYHLTSPTAMMVTITSFGFAVIIPSIRIYLNDNVRQLKWATLIGSLIPLGCYIIWDGIIMGVVPPDHLATLMQSQHAVSDLVATLNVAVPNSAVGSCVDVFTSVCVLTSFLGVSLTLTDFWADALQMEKKGLSKGFIFALAFLPPLIIVLFFPGVFVRALEYAGYDCVILFILLPAWMVWQGRYHRQLSAAGVNGLTVPGGRFLLILLILFAFLLLVHSL